jgi:hypothetical protein
MAVMTPFIAALAALALVATIGLVGSLPISLVATPSIPLAALTIQGHTAIRLVRRGYLRHGY